MPNIVALFTHIIDTLRRAVGIDMARRAQPPLTVLLGTQVFVALVPPERHRPLAAEIWHLLLGRAARLADRFRRLHASWQAGTLRSIRPRIARSGAGRLPSFGPHPLRLPRRRGWINRHIEATASCGGNLQALLYLPEMERFLAEVPRAGRLLRPLCHALAVELPPCLRLPRARPVAPASFPPQPQSDALPPGTTPATPFREKPIA